nr:hypothetical protein [Endozoicomonas sp.]
MDATQQNQANSINPISVQKSDQGKNPETTKASFFGRVIKVIYEIVTFIPRIIWSCIKYIYNAIKFSVHDREVRPQAPPPLYRDVTTQEELADKHEKVVVHESKYGDLNNLEHIYDERYDAEQRLIAAEKKEQSRRRY